MIKEGKNKKTYKVITKEVDNTLNEKDMSAIDYIQYKYPETARAFQDFQFAQWELFCKNFRFSLVKVKECRSAPSLSCLSA